MLRKLMKYECIRIGKVTVWLLLAVLLTAAAAKLTDAIYNGSPTVLWLVIDKLVDFTAVLVMAAALFGTFLRTVIGFARTVYGKQSYLTHTLPVKRSAVFDAKALSGIAMNLLAFCVVGAGVALVFLNGEFAQILKALWDEIGGFLTVSAITLLLEQLTFLLCVYLGIVLGHRRNTGKVVWSVVFTLVSWYAVSALLTGAEAVTFLVNGNLADLMRSNGASLGLGPVPDGIRLMLTVAACGYAAAMAALYVIARKLLAKGVNVD